MKNLTMFLLLAFIVATVNAQVSPESLQSLRVSAYKIEGKDTVGIIRGTGFVIKSKTSYYLITNEHIVTNKQRSTGKWVVDKAPYTPNHIFIEHRSAANPEKTIGTWEVLVASGKRKYVQFSLMDDRIMDVVAIPLKDTSSSKTQINPLVFDPYLEGAIALPANVVTIIGYPHGKSFDYGLPVWKSGMVASEPNTDQFGEPVIWVDMLGYKGMSGSPVYLITDQLVKPDEIATAGQRFVIFLGILCETEETLQLSKIIKASYLKGIFAQLK